MSDNGALHAVIKRRGQKHNAGVYDIGRSGGGSVGPFSIARPDHQKLRIKQGGAIPRYYGRKRCAT